MYILKKTKETNKKRFCNGQILLKNYFISARIDGKKKLTEALKNFICENQDFINKNNSRNIEMDNDCKNIKHFIMDELLLNRLLNVAYV